MTENDTAFTISAPVNSESNRRKRKHGIKKARECFPSGVTDANSQPPFLCNNLILI